MPVANAVSAGAHRGRRVADAADRQAEEDRHAGDRAEEQGLRTCSCKGHLTDGDLYSPDVAAGHGIDEYLETIYFLAFPIGEYRPVATGSQTIASRVAEMLGVSRASAGEMLKRLEAEGLVERGEHKEAILTPDRRRTRARRSCASTGSSSAC